ncbi:MAG: heme exporter protein CcmD [Chloroflexi bacterium]|nr:heme exporter protein CcmD [Chloroflexota bacterium]
MLLQSTPFVTPENAAYLLFGLGVTFAILAILIGSMVLRYRNLRKDMEVIEQLREDDN